MVIPPCNFIHSRWHAREGRDQSFRYSSGSGSTVSEACESASCWSPCACSGKAFNDRRDTAIVRTLLKAHRRLSPGDRI